MVSDGSSAQRGRAISVRPPGILSSTWTPRGGVLRGTTSVARVLGQRQDDPWPAILRWLSSASRASCSGSTMRTASSKRGNASGSTSSGTCWMTDFYIWQLSYEFGLDRLCGCSARSIQLRNESSSTAWTASGKQPSIPTRTIRFTTAPLSELRARKITTILTEETMKAVGGRDGNARQINLALVENLLLLEYMTIGPKFAG